jgi:membrane protease YdiL (CAAX protease family)
MSVAIRVLYHLYQGPASAGIIPIGFVFAYWYARTGRLWPAVIAHGLMDFFGLIVLMGR